MARQQLLFSERVPHFEAVVDESVLHRVVGSQAIMRGQLERLLELSDLPRGRFSLRTTNVGRRPIRVRSLQSGGRRRASACPPVSITLQVTAASLPAVTVATPGMAGLMMSDGYQLAGVRGTVRIRGGRWPCIRRRRSRLNRS